MVNQISVEGGKSIRIAPGKGKIPTNILHKINFDVRAFPKHHPNSQFGIYHVRKQKLMLKCNSIKDL